jgi:hypothetical protein
LDGAFGVHPASVSPSAATNAPHFRNLYVIAASPLSPVSITLLERPSFGAKMARATGDIILKALRWAQASLLV